MENTLSLKSILMIVIVILLLKPLLNCKKEGMSNTGICKSINRDECADLYCNLHLCKKYKEDGWPKNFNDHSINSSRCKDEQNNFNKKSLEMLIKSQAYQGNLCKIGDMAEFLDKTLTLTKEKIKEIKVEKKNNEVDPVADLMKSINKVTPKRATKSV
tara:strand:+ start:947 stop:1420 length:474 start_codon:yes stop_codon:yes gene_type:complete